VQIGRLREPITIKARATTTDVGPGKTVAWTTTIATPRACIEPKATREQPQAGATTATAAYDVTIRYRTTVTTAHRITWGTKTLQIHGVTNPDGRRIWSLLDCSEVQ
jgi:SPP1 family predicted phage head-tail adaptor